MSAAASEARGPEPAARDAAESLRAAPGGAQAPRVRLGAATTIVTGLAAPWGLTFLPDGSALVAERDSGRVLKVGPRGGRAVEVGRLREVAPNGEAGLLGLAVRQGWVYAYYTGASDNRVVRFRIGGAPQPVVVGIPKASFHDGGRIAFGPDGMLYIATGDASVTSRAQDRDSLGGKILRVTPEGRAAPGNPFPGSRVWSLGHRNVQGLAWDPAGRMYATEFGQNTWDEVNRIEKGRNYGWPRVEGRGGGSRYTDPLAVWPTSQASPSGLARAGDSLFAAALRGQRLWQLRLDGRGGLAGAPVAHLQSQFGRLRTVVVEPGGRALWVTTSNRDGRGSPRRGDDRILRLPLVSS